MNCKNPPFNNVKVRQAVAYAIPYQKIMDAVMFGLAKPMYGGKATRHRALAWPQPHGYNDRHRQGQGADGGGRLCRTASRPRCRSIWASA